MYSPGTKAVPTAKFPDPTQYDAIILDLGGVILNLDLNRSFERFRTLIPWIEPSTFVGRENQLWFYSDFELGKLEPEELLVHFNEHHRSRLRFAQFLECWNAMILDFPPKRLELLRSLGKKKRLFLLSNINPIHETELHKRYEAHSQEPFSRLFEKMYFSHRLGLRKPNLEVFQYLIDENGLENERTLFIDDSPQHILGASKSGLRAIHLSAPETLESIFKLL